MNWYFWCFALYALWITPVTAHVSLRLADGLRVRVRMQAAGLPMMTQDNDENLHDEQKVESRTLVKKLFAMDVPAAAALVRDGWLQKALRCWRVREVYVHARLSLMDAAQTALGFAAARTLLLALSACAGGQLPLRGRIEADFHSEGAQVFVRCILAARLGSLCAAAIGLMIAIRRTRAATAQEEETYAAAPH